jgi:hypothetical protein
MNFTAKDVLNMVSAVTSFIETSGEIYNRCPDEEIAESIAFREQESFPKQLLVKDVYARGGQSMELAADHLMAFADCFVEPAKTVAPWTCVRGLLESCALAAWFLDPAIDARARVGRCFAFRYAGFVQQIKWFQVDGRQVEIDRTKRRISKVEQDAVSLGYPRLVNERGEITGIAQRMPTITELIKTTLNREADYRLLSAVAHGHHWATHQTSFRVVEVEDSEGQVQKRLEKYVHPNFVLFIANIAVTSFSQVIWHLWQVHGWNMKEIGDLLDLTYEALQYNPDLRFWHKTSSTTGCG